MFILIKSSYSSCAEKCGKLRSSQRNTLKQKFLKSTSALWKSAQELNPRTRLKTRFVAILSRNRRRGGTRGKQNRFSTKFSTALPISPQVFQSVAQAWSSRHSCLPARADRNVCPTSTSVRGEKGTLLAKRTAL